MIRFSAAKLTLDKATYEGIEQQLELGQKSCESVLKATGKAAEWGRRDAPDFERGQAIKADEADLRRFQAWLKEQDPGFGGLVRVQNKRREFLWVHPKFETEY